MDRQSWSSSDHRAPLLLAIVAVVTTSASSLQITDDAPSWSAIIGAATHLEDVCLTNTGVVWAAGTAIAVFEPERHVWHATDWIRGYEAQALKVDSTGTGWALMARLGPDDNYASGAIGAIRNGILQSVADYASVIWSDLDEVPNTTGAFAVGWNTETAVPVFYALTPEGRWAVQPVRLPPRSELQPGDELIRGVDVIDTDTAYAVGTSGAVWAWNGVTWALLTRSPTGGSRGTFDISAVSASDIWVGGGNGPDAVYLARYNGLSWAVITADAALPQINSLVVNADSQGWAVGYCGVVYRIDGDSILEVDTTWPRGSCLNALRNVEFAPGKREAFAVGHVGQLVTIDNAGVRFSGEFNSDGLYTSAVALDERSVVVGGTKCENNFCYVEPGRLSPAVVRITNGGMQFDALPDAEGQLLDLVQTSMGVVAVGGVPSYAASDGTDHGFVMAHRGEHWELIASYEDRVVSGAVEGAEGHMWIIASSTRGQSMLAVITEIDELGQTVNQWWFDDTSVDIVARTGDGDIVCAGRRDGKGESYIWRYEGASWIPRWEGTRRIKAIVTGFDGDLVFAADADSHSYVCPLTEPSCAGWRFHHFQYGPVFSAARVGQHIFVSTANGSVLELTESGFEERFVPNHVSVSTDVVYEFAGIDLGEMGFRLWAVGKPGLVLSYGVGSLHAGTETATLTPAVHNTPGPTVGPSVTASSPVTTVSASVTATDTPVMLTPTPTLSPPSTQTRPPTMEGSISLPLVCRR